MTITETIEAGMTLTLDESREAAEIVLALVKAGIADGTFQRETKIYRYSRDQRVRKAANQLIAAMRPPHTYAREADRQRYQRIFGPIYQTAFAAGKAGPVTL